MHFTVQDANLGIPSEPRNVNVYRGERFLGHESGDESRESGKQFSILGFFLAIRPQSA